LEGLFEQRCDELQIQGAGDVLAVDGPNVRLTYAELDARANQLGRFIRRSYGVCAGDRIGLLFDQPETGYVGMLAVLKLRAAFVPLDAGSPSARLAHIVSDAEVTIVLSESSLTEIVRDLDEEVRVLRLDEVEHVTGMERDGRLDSDELEGAGEDLCYVIYTSGTTGRPKGVEVGHRSICNFVRVAADVYGLAGDDRVYQGLTMAFDFSFEEIWVAWMVGATLVPRPTGASLIGQELHDFLSDQCITALFCVPTLLATLDEDLPELRFLLVSGEPCPQDLVDRWHRPDRRFLNTYGPTEATVSATWTLLHPSRRVSIGVPLPTYSVVILDPGADRAVPRGQSGELGIAGIGLADGYLGRPELTDRAFIPDFLSIPDNPSGRIYRTGDLACVNDDGEIEHHGRIDTQVKIRGYRVELGEIESVLRQLPGVAQAAVGIHEADPGLKELVAYYSARSEADPVDSARVYEWLRDKLPAYMVPTYLERLEELPLMSSGKLDRANLPAPSGPRSLTAGAHYVAPESDIESLLAGELASVLGVERVSVEGHFFDELGANSLLMAHLSGRLRNSAGDLPPVSMRDVYAHPTVRSLAKALSDHGSESESAAPRWEEPMLPEPIGVPRYYLCGALQLLAFLGYVCLAGVALDAGGAWLTAAHGVGLYARAVLVGGGVLLGTGLFPIAAKWVLIGRFKPQRIRVWSLTYLRFWIVKTLVVSNPVAHLVIGSPLYPLYLRALGARIGSRALILTHHVPVCTDLLRVGTDSVIRKNTFLNGYRARAGVIEIGPVTIGDRAFVGEATVLDIHTTLGDDAQLGHASSMQAGQIVPAGQCWHGSAARPAPAGCEYRMASTHSNGTPRGAIYGASRLLLLLTVAGPLGATVSTFLFTHELDRAPVTLAPILAAAVLFGLLMASVTAAIALPRLLTRWLTPGKTYPLYGLHYALQRVAARTSNNPLLTVLFGDSCAIPHYLRLIGWRLQPLEQTGSNFGCSVKHELPRLSQVGTGTMVSDGLSMMNAEFSSSSFRVVPVVIGERNFLGNLISYPAGGRTGDNCLLATKVQVPTYGPRRSNVGLLALLRDPSLRLARQAVRPSQLGRRAAVPPHRKEAAQCRHDGTPPVRVIPTPLGRAADRREPARKYRLA
jgi:non-ribosomal peptide synthetase-like protein